MDRCACVGFDWGCVLFKTQKGGIMRMFEGKELEGKIADVGTYSVDLMDDGTAIAEAGAEKSLGSILKIKAGLSIQLDAIQGLRQLAAKSNKVFLIASVEALAKSLGR